MLDRLYHDDADQAQFLSRLSLFSGLGADALADLARGVETRVYADGDVIIAKGDEGDGLFVLRKGAARAQLKTGNSTKTLATFTAADIFGEMALFDSEPRSATVQAVGRCEVLKLSRKAFMALVEQRPQVLWNFCVEFTKRLRATSQLAHA